MERTEAILAYLTEAYHPDAVIVYGSFADGSAGEHSDFDALVIADVPRGHDGSVVQGTELDVFLYPPETFASHFDPEEFLPVSDGEILLDKSGTAARLKAAVRDWTARQPRKTDAELRQALAWCEKMLARTLREDAEGFFRWHWLLTDSLEIYCDGKGSPYLGPKKALREMERADPGAYALYARALRTMDRDALAAWVAYLRRLTDEA